jgi:hypothetical protein
MALECLSQEPSAQGRSARGGFFMPGVYSLGAPVKLQTCGGSSEVFLMVGARSARGRGQPSDRLVISGFLER